MKKSEFKKLVREEVKNPLKESKQYADIIFLQNSQDFSEFKDSGGKGEEGFFNSSEKEMAKYLSQWDDGAYHNIYDGPGKPWGTSDTVSKVSVPNAGKYILSYNSGLGYAGLHKIV